MMNESMDRRSFLNVLGKGMVALSFSLLGCGNQSNRNQPNIVIIMADDLGYGDISCYDGWIDTPNLDRLAAEGMKFTDYHAGAPVCSPTRVGLLTGRYQQRAGLPSVIYASRQRNRHQGLKLEEVTFAEIARQAGYATGVYGKWHLGYQEKYNPVHQGFDDFRGYVSGNVDYFSHIDGIGVHDWWDENKKIHEDGYVTYLVNEHAVQFIGENQKHPFCLYVAHEAPHYPYQGPDDEPIRQEGKRIPEERDPEQVRRAYREMVRAMDQGIGQILDMLDRHNLSENTFLFFCSDNGAVPYGSNGDLRGWKGSLWEGGHRVPAIAWWPGRIPAGTTTEALTICLDVMPTIADLTNTPIPDGRPPDGHSLLPIVLNQESPEERWLFWEYEGQQAVRHGDWKLLRDVEDRVGNRKRLGVALYNLTDDPGETTNLIEKHPEQARSMLQALGTWQQDVFTGATLQIMNDSTNQ